MIFAEIEVDNEGILAQMNKTKEAQWEFNKEMDKLEKMLRKVKVKAKGDSEESPQV